jgi:hypothetical protein
VGSMAMAAGLAGAGAAHAASGVQMAPGGPRMPASPKNAIAGAALASATLPALTAREQSYSVFNADLSPSSGTAGATIVYVSSLAGSYVGPAGGWLGMTCNVPVGSLITAVDCTLNGNPRGGSSVYCDEHAPGGGGFVGTIDSKYFTAGTGVETQTLTINKRYTGAEVFEIYFGGLSATSVARGVRVRYIPPSAGYVPLTPVRIFDSGSTPVGTTYRVLQVTGKAGIPADATAAVLNTQVSNPTKSGTVRLMPYGKNVTAATQVFAAHQTISNLSVVKLISGKVQVRLTAGSARVMIDVSGYFMT